MSLPPPGDDHVMAAVDAIVKTAWTTPHQGLAASAGYSIPPDWKVDEYLAHLHRLVDRMGRPYFSLDATPENMLRYGSAVMEAHYRPGGIEPQVQLDHYEGVPSTPKPTLASLRKTYLAANPMDPTATLDFVLGVEGLEEMGEDWIPLFDPPVCQRHRPLGAGKLFIGLTTPLVFALIAIALLYALVMWLT